MRILEINNSIVKATVKYLSLLAITLILVSSAAFGQSNKLIDSLENQLKNEKSVTRSIDLMISLSSAYAFVDFPKSIKFAKEAVELANKTDQALTKYRANQQLSMSYTLAGDYTSALKHETLALQIALNSADSSSLGLSHSNIGNLYFEIGEYDEAYFYLTQAYRILQKTAKNRFDTLYMNIALHNVGRVFKELGQYETALKHLRLSQKISKEIEDEEGGPYSNNEIGDVKLKMKEYDSALYYFTLALNEGKVILKKSSQTTLRELQPKTLAKLAQVYLIRDEYDKAFAYYDSTLKIHELTGNKLGLAEVELGRGNVLIKQNRKDEAMRSINHALELAQEVNARILEIECYQQLALIWEQKGDFKKSLEFFKQFKVLEDSLFSNEMQQKLLRDQIRFETASKDDRIAALTRAEEEQKSETRKQEFIRNILVVVVALTAILLFTVYRSGQRRKQINELLLQHQQDMEKRSAELEQLNKVKDKFFSIISHDLRSPINALAGIMDLMDRGAIAPEELPGAIKELRIRFNHTRSLMNNLLDWTVLQMDKMNLQASQVDIYKLVNENIDLLGAIQDKKINLINKVKENSIAFADNNTINLVIRNLLTNAIKFTNDGGEISIDAEAKDKEWLVSVHDNGIGITPDIQSRLFDKINPYSTRGTANEKGTGLGLLLCKEFVEKNGGRIWVESTENKGSTFWFTIPKA
jgi:signal transduction histidine kinase/predicted negative regulator of RcsB-dependent stress response